MKHPPVAIVDEHDNVVGAADLREAWQKGLIHRIVRIMVEDEQGNILLQKRSAEMDLFPNCWDHSAAGHVDEGEDYETAARRELAEELGVHEAMMTEVAHYRTDDTIDGRRLNRFNKLYRVILPAGWQFSPDKHEVSEVRWFTLQETKKLIAEHAYQVTEGLTQVMQDYYENHRD